VLFRSEENEKEDKASSKNEDDDRADDASDRVLKKTILGKHGARSNDSIADKLNQGNVDKAGRALDGASSSGLRTGSTDNETTANIDAKIAKVSVDNQGSMRVASARDVLTRRLAVIEGCVERETKTDSVKPKSSWTLPMKIGIGNAGRVTAIEAGQGTLSPSVVNCVEQTIRRVRFARPEDGPVVVDVDFLFEVAKSDED
jgi:hypothetical protein